jgi:predicted AAA+ superfamily ATPase
MPVIDTLIAEFQNQPLPSLTPRDIRLPAIQNTADVVIGMRRTGKTFTLFQEMSRLIEQGVDRRRMLYVNLEDDRLGQPTLATLSDILESFYRYSPEARGTEAFLFFDEIQVVDGWSRFARRVLDTESVRLYLSGSSAKLLSTEVATEFRGRGAAVEVLPFSFAESARHAGIALPDALPGSRSRSRLEAHLLSFLNVGGFPAVQDIEYADRIRLLQDYVELVVVRDVVERHGITNLHAAKTFALGLVRSTGRLFSVNKTHNTMRSQGTDVGKNTLHALLDHLNDAYLVFPVSIFRVSHHERLRAPRKIYAIDPGLALATSVAAAEDIGARLETAVYLELRRRTGRLRDGTISYLSTPSGHEVDFVVGDVEAGQARELIQVCANMDDAVVRARETRALEEATGELGLSSSTIVTLVEDSEIETPKGVIRVIPAWRWMLGL